MCTAVSRKVFEIFTHLPTQLAQMVIGNMQPDAKMSFSRCSKLSQNQVNASRSLIHEISFYATSETNLSISVSYGKCEDSGRIFGYKLVYMVENEDEEKILKCLNAQNREEVWKIALDGSVDLVDLAAQKFKDLLGTYGNKIKKLGVHGSLFATRLENFDFGAGGFRNLEVLHVFAKCDILQILAKLRRPLKELYVDNEENCRILANSKHIYQVQHKLCLGSTSLDIAQFLDFSSAEIVIPIGNINENNIINFIRLWQIDAVNKKIRRCQWDLADSTFNARRLLGLLNLPLLEYLNKPGVESFEIKHRADSGKSARIVYKYDDAENGRQTLEFITSEL